MSRSCLVLFLFLSLAGCFPLPVRSEPVPESGVDDLLHATVIVRDSGTRLCAGVAVSGDLVLTAAHCVASQDNVRVTLYRDRSKGYEYTVIHYDAVQDIAVLSPLELVPSHPHVLLSEFPPVLGQRVVAVGHPKSLYWTMTTGIISYPRRVGNRLSAEQVWTQASSGIAAGSSGGPLTNVYGELLGIASFSWKSYSMLGGFVHVSELRSALDR